MARTREEIEQEIAFKVKTPAISVGAVGSAIQSAILETLLDIRDGSSAKCIGLPGGTAPHSYCSVYAQEKNHTSLFCQSCGESKEF